MHADSDEEVNKGLRDTAIEMLAATLNTLVPGSSIVVAGLVGMTKLLLDGKKKFDQRREILATAHIALGLDLPEGEEGQKALAGMLADPVVSETIVHSFQRMTDATSSAAWPCIAVLTGDYVREGQPVDGFFHDAVAVLASLDDEGLVAAETLLAKAEPHKDRIGRGKRLTVNYNERPRQDLTFTMPEELEKEEYFSPAPPGVQRALRILGANGFGQVRGDQITLGGAGTEEPCWRLLGYLRRRADSGTRQCDAY